jgi:hypothetical protein
MSSQALLGGLLLVLVIGLVWALNPSGEPGPSPHRPGSRPPALSQKAPPSPKATSTPVTARKNAPTTEQVTPSAALIAAAPPPAFTTMQVLDAGGGRERLRAAASALSALGYRVVSTSSARQDVTRTTVWFTSGNETKAEALRARDPRFADVAPNAGLSAQVDLHVLIGPDWQQAVP